ncbi:MAG: hypothetical protein ABSA30_08520 [Candidatus Aminicenantales bacterium]
MENVAVLGAAGKMGSGIVLLTALEMADLSLDPQNQGRTFALQAVDVSPKALSGLMAYLRGQAQKAAEKKAMALRKVYELRADLVENEEIIRRNSAGLREFGDLHRIKKPKPDSSDPYHKNWRGGVKLSDMAAIDGRELYDGPYAELSDWEHWGLSGIGEAISRENNRVTVSSNSDHVAGRSLLAAFQCLFQTLEVADAHLSLNITDTIQTLGKDFKETLDSFYQSGTRDVRM